MDINELKNLYTKLLYQETLDLDDDGARYILQDLVGAEINRLRKGQKATEVKMVDRSIFKQIEDALSLVKSIANRKVSINEDFMQIVGEDNHLWNIICDALDATR